MIDFNIYIGMSLHWVGLKVKFFQMVPNFDGTGREKSLVLG